MVPCLLVNELGNADAVLYLQTLGGNLLSLECIKSLVIPCSSYPGSGFSKVPRQMVRRTICGRPVWDCCTTDERLLYMPVPVHVKLTGKISRMSTMFILAIWPELNSMTRGVVPRPAVIRLDIAQGFH